MEGKQIRLGSVSLLCSFILVCVAVLTVLCIATTRADWQLTSRSAEVTTQWYELQNDGQRWLAQADAALRRDGWDAARFPEGSLRQGDAVTVTLEREGRTLTIRLERAQEGADAPWVLALWRSGTEWVEEPGPELYKKGDLP